MRVFIAEKPAMGKEIAKRLPGPHSQKDGYIETGGGIVTWCIGHLLETAPPDAYDVKFEKFPGTFDMLPIIPQDWKLKISDSKSKQVNTIKTVLKKATEVINAGDPGREGQLIIDELLDFLGNKRPVKRILLNALDDITIKTELNNLHDNKQFYPLYQAGLGRQRADWLVGMNLSRAYTILGGKSGYRGVLSVGRVQSPTLAIVVRRDEEIESFVPKTYYTIKADFFTQAHNSTFTANWVPPYSSDAKGQVDASTDDEDESDPALATTLNGAYPWIDEHHRIIDQNQAQNIVNKINNKTATVIHAHRNTVDEQAPLPFDLSAMQILANARWGASVQETLQACQNLYEKGFLSYPRTDCCYLPENQHQDAALTIEAISKSLSTQFSNICNGATPSIKSRAWNDNKMGEHHAIIPTKSVANLSGLSELEKNIYLTSALRYLAQFYPAAKVDKMKIVLDCEQEFFVARGRSIVSAGWRNVYGGNDDSEQSEDNTSESQQDDALLPPLKNNETTLCKNPQLKTNQTKPPSRYTQGTLLKAMKQVHLLVSDPAVKKKLKAVEGIGRSATRASIVETLIKRAFLQSKGKQIISTQVGRALIKALPEKLIDPALTALWETALDSVAVGRTPLDAFMAKQHDWLIKLVETSKEKQSTGISNLPISEAPQYNKTPSKSNTSSSYTKPTSTATNSPKNNSAKPPAKGKTCPQCKKGTMSTRTIKQGPSQGKTFMGCSNYPECKHTEWPK